MASKVSGVVEKIKTGGTSHAIASTAYGYCETIASEAAKTVDMTGFELNEGVTIHVKFANANTAASPTLNVNGKGAKPIVQYGTTAASTADETNGWYAGAVVSFTYDGTSWVRDQGFNTNTWRGIVDNLTSSTNTTQSLSAKQGYLLANGSARDNTKLPLAGGIMTGNIRRYYSGASSEPMITMLSNNQDILLWEAGHGTSAASTTTANHYKLLYKGTGSDTDNSNYLQLIVHKTEDKIAIQIDELGTVTFPQMNLGNATKPIYINNGVFTEGTAIGASAYHADSYFALSGHTHGNITNSGLLGNANRLVWTDGDKKIYAGYHYANSTKVAINSSSEPTENFYVSGTVQINLGTSNTSSNNRKFIVQGESSNKMSIAPTGIQVYNSSNAVTTLYLQAYGGNLIVGASGYATATRDMYGVFDFKTASGFNYSGIGAGTDNADRNVWFSFNGKRGVPVYDDDFKYNPSTNTLKVGTGSFNGGILKLQAASSDPSISAGARIEFTFTPNTNYPAGQPVYISYTPNDSYRQPAGLKVMGGTSATPAWFEVEGDIFAAKFNGDGSTLTNLTPTNLNGVVTTTAKKFLKDTGAWTQVDWGDLTGKPSSFTPSSHTHYELATIGDKRSENTTPNTYKNRIIFQGLKGNNYINSPYTDVYSYLVGLRGWSDSSGGNAHELAFNGNGIYRRQGATDTWGNWYHILDSGNTASGTNNAATLTWSTEYTIAKINGTNIKFTTMAKPSYSYNDIDSRPTSIKLTGAVTGSVTLGNGENSIATTVNHNHNSSYLTAVGYDTTNKKIYYTKNGSNTDVVTAATLRTDMGLSNALHFIGITSTTLTDGSTTSTLTAKSTNSLSKTTNFVDGDVVMDGDQLREYVWSGSAWRLLGITTSEAYSQTATGNSWITSITQGTDGKITATTGTLNTSGEWSGNAATASSISATGGTAAKFWRGDNTWSDTISGGLLKIKNNTVTVTIGSANSSWVHFTNDKNVSFYFGNGVSINGDLNPYGTNNTRNFGGSGAYWKTGYITTLNSSILKLHQGTNADPSTSSNARIEFDYSSGQPVYIAYTPNDSYRAPAGLKVMGNGATSGTGYSSPAWFEVEGAIYGASFNGSASGLTSIPAEQLTGTIPTSCYTNTTYTNGTGLSLYGTTFNHSNSVTAKTSYGSTATTASANNGTIIVTDIKYDAQGHITSSTDRTITLSQTTYNFSGASFTSGKSDTSEHDANKIKSNGVWSITSNGPASVTGLGAQSGDMSLYTQFWGTSWGTQIAADYRDGQLFVRALKNGDWQSWYAIPKFTTSTGGVGGTTTPVYIDTNGDIQACNTYAGGTAVTLNGTSKASSTASFYAPTGAGTNGQYLKSSGSGAPTWATLTKADISDFSHNHDDRYKIASGVITLGSNTITPVTSVNGHNGSSVTVTASDLGLASALKYVGSKSTLPTATDSTTYSTYNNGDVITVSNKEYAYVKGSNAAGSSWVELGDEGSYKLKQTAITKPTATTNKWVSAIGQDANGNISADYASLNTSGTWSGNATTATTATYIKSTDSRSDIINPNGLKAAQGVRFDFKSSTVTGLDDWSGVMSYRPYASNSDWSGGPAHQLAFDGNGLHWRKSTNDTTWSSWKTIAFTDSNITGNAETATTATNLSAKPTLAAGTSDTNKITVTAGGKKSDEFTVPYATYSKFFYMKVNGNSGWTMNANAPTHTIMADYGSGSTKQNMPTGWNYGGLFTIGTTTSYGSMSSQLAWDVAHNTNKAGRLWFRTNGGGATDSSGWKAWAEVATSNCITNNNITIARDTETTLATIAGVAIKIKLPASDNTWRPIGTGATDAMAGNTVVTNVAQSESTTTNWRKVILSYQKNDSSSAAVTSGTTNNVVYTSRYVSIQPSSGILYAGGGTITPSVGTSGWIQYPGGGVYKTNTPDITGALKITLPQVNKSVMMSFDVHLYTCNGNNASSVVYHIHGYEYSANGWHNPVCRVYSEGIGTYTNLKVRFGADNNKAYVTIGETTTAWRYPQVAISNVHLGYSDNWTYGNWGTGWSISFVTTLPSASTGSRENINTQNINITGSATTLANLYDQDHRPTNANITHIENGGVQHFISKDGTTTNGPGTGNVLHFHWDTAQAWDSQLYVPDVNTGSLKWRGSSAAGTWGNWVTVLDSANYSTHLSSTYLKCDGSNNSTWLRVVNNSSANTDDALVYIENKNSGDWATKIDVGGYNYGLKIAGTGSYLLQVGTNNVLEVNDNNTVTSRNVKINGKLVLSRATDSSYGRISFYNSSYHTWITYMSSVANGFAPTGGKPSTLGNVTDWALHSLIENTNNKGWIWEAAAEAAVTDTTLQPTARMALSSATGQLRIAPNASTTGKETAGLIIDGAKNASNGNVAIELWRGTKTSWQIANESGSLYLRDNYGSSTVSDTYNHTAISIGYNNTGITVSNSIIPGANNTYELGSTTNRWKTLYIESQSNCITNGIVFYTGTTVKARIGSNKSNGDFGIYGTNLLYLRPDLNDTSKGIEVRSSCVVPTTDLSVNLGVSTNRWSNIYGDTVRAKSYVINDSATPPVEKAHMQWNATDQSIDFIFA